MDLFMLMLAPFAACLVLTGILCYFGLHIVTRGVIFVDLALAQVAALGGTLALLLGYHMDSQGAYGLSLGFTFLGAAVFALGRFRDELVPQEAIIGIVYAVASAASILVLDQAPHGHEAITAMLVGSVLFVQWPTVARTAAICAAVGVIHYLLRKKFTTISTDPDRARKTGMAIRFWDFVFYATFGFVVTSEVRIAGVLLVFTYLVVPAVCAMLFAKEVKSRLLMGWGLGFLGSVVGLYLSAVADLPTGASVVTVFGLLVCMCAVVRPLVVRSGCHGKTNAHETAET